MKEKVKYYKDEQSYFNQMGFFKLNFNQVRTNKETTQFKKIKTSDYDSLLQEMQDQNQYEYICAGLNSYEREVVVIDSDDITFGKATLDKLNQVGLVPHCQKIKNNGHSQTYFFIEKYNIGKGYFDNNGAFKEVDYEYKHLVWKRLTKLINFLFEGDICYTGFNCQNPLYVNANTVSYRNINKLYTVDELYHFCLSHFTKVDDLDDYLSFLRKQALSLKPKHKEQIENDIKTVIVFRNKIDNGQSVDVKDIQTFTEQATDHFLDACEKTINERIFILCCQICKSFKMRNALNFDNFDEISRTCYKNFNAQDYAKGYSCNELIKRIRDDIREIILKDRYNQMLWTKVGYTNIQRQKSLETRKNKKEQIKQIIKSMHTIITTFQMSEMSEIKKAYKIVDLLKEQNIKVSYKTVINYLKEIENENKEKEIINNDIENKTNQNKPNNQNQSYNNNNFPDIDDIENKTTTITKCDSIQNGLDLLDDFWETKK